MLSSDSGITEQLNFLSLTFCFVLNQVKLLTEKALKIYKKWTEVN